MTVKTYEELLDELDSYNQRTLTATEEYESNLPIVQQLIDDAETAVAAAGYTIVGDFADVVKVEITNPNEVYTSKSVAGFEDYVWRTNQTLPYTPTGSDPGAAPEAGKWVAVAIGELETAAIALNTSNTNIIFDIDTISAIPEYIRAKSQQINYKVPVAAQGNFIDTVVGNQLTTTEPATYTLAIIVNYPIAPDSYPNSAQGYADYLEEIKINRTAALIDDTLTSDVVVDGNGIKGTGVESVITPQTTVGLELDRHITSPAHDWTKPALEDFSIIGDVGRSFNGATFGSNPLSGRYAFSRVSFKDLDKAIEKPTGNIGNTYESVTFRDVNYGIHATSNAFPMHSGADTFRSAHWDGVDKACYYINDNIDGSGGWVVRDSIAEQCDGFFMFGDFGNRTPFTPPVLDNVWMELIAQASTTEIDSVVYTTRQLYIKDCPVYRMRDMYLQSAQLINSIVHADCIRIDDAVQTPDFGIDLDSELIVDNLYGDGTAGGKPFVRSILSQENTSNTKNLSVRGPLALKEIPSVNYGGVNVYSNNFAGAGPWQFNISGGGTNNATSVSDGVINSTCAEITIPAGEIHFDNVNGTPTTAKWVVWSAHVKFVSGEIDNAEAKLGFNMTLGETYFKSGHWIRSYGIQKTDTVASLRFYIDNSASATPLVLRFGDIFVREFNTRSEALEAVNSSMTII